MSLRFLGRFVEIAVANELDVPVVGYDIFDILSLLAIPNKDPKGYQEAKEIQANERKLLQWKEVMKKHWKGESKLEGWTWQPYIILIQYLLWATLFRMAIVFICRN